jgi:hypothetical protein
MENRIRVSSLTTDEMSECSTFVFMKFWVLISSGRSEALTVISRGLPRHTQTNIDTFYVYNVYI